MCVSMHACVHECMCACACTCIHARAYVCMHACRCTCACMNVHAHMHASTHAHTHACTCVCVCVHVCGYPYPSSSFSQNSGNIRLFYDGTNLSGEYMAYILCVCMYSALYDLYIYHVNLSLTKCV